MKKQTHLIVYFFAFMAGSPAISQQTPQKYIQETHYLLYLPDGYRSDTTTRWPLMMFLHGSGESGTDLNKVKTHGPAKLIEQGKKFPFIVVTPQATNGWKDELLFAIIRDLKTKYRVDADRVYLTGLSMGGYGTWSLAMAYPDVFAAIAPICGGGDTAKIYRLRHIPVWNFHGAKDNVVPLAASEKMMAALQPYNPQAKFTIYPEADHDSWTQTYNNDSLYHWMLSQKRFRYTETPQKAADLARFTGEFLAPIPIDTIVIYVQGDSLMVNTRKGSNNILRLKPFNENTFFFFEEMPAQITFKKNKRGIYDTIQYEGEELITFKKVGLPAKSNRAARK